MLIQNENQPRFWITCEQKVLFFYPQIAKLPLKLLFDCELFYFRFESVIHEFDPYFNYRTTKYLAEKGFYNFHNWFDDRAWYPLGRIIGGTIYPGKGCIKNFKNLSDYC